MNKHPASGSIASLLTIVVVSPFFVALCFDLTSQNISQAATVYSQTNPDEPRRSFSSGTSQIVADNFVLTGSSQNVVRSLRFVGGYGLTMPPPLTPPLDSLPNDDFRVIFFEDAGGGPGVPVVNGDFSSPEVVVRTPRSGPLLNGIYNPIEYWLDLGEGIALSTSAVYWLSISNDAGDEHFWGWARGNYSYDANLASTFDSVESGPWQVGSGGGMWFELNNVNVPEPASHVLLSIALSTALLSHRRRSADF
ncbi:hypothetical protein HG15A2_27770 [Adhaeretor mobilis]|uniref:PEP-CTERM protein-sorting domain-containing protein n=1 Tax=Adhaeretor mobilis TaxID=1930276 RepID=A0A517MX44_9BACT|nr:hypothetical protein HG15A2_27770 [Adhaeretor mobilis]